MPEPVKEKKLSEKIAQKYTSQSILNARYKLTEDLLNLLPPLLPLLFFEDLEVGQQQHVVGLEEIDGLTELLGIAEGKLEVEGESDKLGLADG